MLARLDSCVRRNDEGKTGMTRAYQQRWNLDSGNSHRMTPCFALCDTLAQWGSYKMLEPAYAFPRRSLGTRMTQRCSPVGATPCGCPLWLPYGCPVGLVRVFGFLGNHKACAELAEVVTPTKEGVAECIPSFIITSSFLRKQESRCWLDWIPACAGMTRGKQK